MHQVLLERVLALCPRRRDGRVVDGGLFFGADGTGVGILGHVGGWWWWWCLDCGRGVWVRLRGSDVMARRAAWVQGRELNDRAAIGRQLGGKWNMSS